MIKYFLIKKADGYGIFNHADGDIYKGDFKKDKNVKFAIKKRSVLLYSFSLILRNKWSTEK